MVPTSNNNTITAKTGINIESVKDTAHTKTETTEKSSGFLTTTTTTQKTEDYVETRLIASLQVNGKSKLTTEGDLNLTAANVGFGQGADITADNVNITGLAVPLPK
jgi:hypothetical protein